MRKLITIAFTVLGLSVDSLAQQANYWYFGDGAGLNFNTTPPQALLDGKLVTSEGCAAISDRHGGLLFYTDGLTIWNRNHRPMPNGKDLLGNPSSTHSAIIIPKPGQDSIYFVITADAANEPQYNGVKGYNYNEVDMRLQGGLGDVNSVKNILLYAPNTEKLAATGHANGIDIWLVTKEFDNHTFRTYRITCDGIDPVPVISIVERTSGTLFGFKGGYIKISPDGTKIANGRMHEGDSRWDLFKFDNSTGIISNRIMFSHPMPYSTGIYGVEFSPDSRLVYVNGKSTSQFKVDVYDSTTIVNSRYTVLDNPDIICTALQLGPDGKIYSNTVTSISVINQPNQYGPACNFMLHGVSLAGRVGMSGLPTFFNRLVTNSNVDFSYEISPDCNSIHFSAVTSIPGPLTFDWDFGGGLTSSGAEVDHLLTLSPDTFKVTLTVSSAAVCGSASIGKKITLPPIHVFAGNDVLIPMNTEYQLQGSGAVSYSWSPATGLNNPFLANPIAQLGNTPQTYYLKGINENGCEDFDTVNIDVFYVAEIYVPGAFTPNADGKNDLLKVICVGMKELNYFRLYDRWGNMIFQTNNPSIGWDGLYKGKKLSTSTFVWVAEGTSMDGKLVQRKGTTTIIR